LNKRGFDPKLAMDGIEERNKNDDHSWIRDAKYIIVSLENSRKRERDK